MTEEHARRRAPAMSPEDRRTAIVRSTLPLLAEHGANITTRHIAQAAGIAEGTVFRVFTDKEELLRTCIREAFRTDEVCARIRELPAERDVETRLTDAGLLFVQHFQRLGTLMQALATSGYDIRDQDHHPKDQDRGPAAFFQDLADAFVALLEPDRDRFRVSPDNLARMAMGLLMSMRFDPEPRDRNTVANRVDALMHGVLSTRVPPHTGNPTTHWGGTYE